MNGIAEPYSLAETADFQDPRWIFLRPSRLALTLLATGVLLAAAALAWSGPQRVLSAAWLAAVALPAAGLLALEIRRVMLWERDAVVAFYLIDLDSVGPRAADAPRLGIRLLGRDGKTLREGVVTAGAYVSPLFTTIPYRLPGGARWRQGHLLSLWADSLEREAFRQVRVRLKWR